MTHDIMEPEDGDLRDPRLSGSLRAALGRERAPEAWVENALAVARARRAPVVAREPLFPLLLPYVAGGLVVVGCAVGFATNPALRAGVDGALRSLGTWLASAPDAPAQSDGAAIWSLLLAVPLFVALVLESTRGFADVKRWLR